MENKNIREEAYKAVVYKERKNGRSAEVIHKKVGYDIQSKGKGRELHIEVKGTTKEYPQFRFLTENEYKKLQEDKNFYLYVVTNVGRKPKVYSFNRKEVQKLLKKKNGKPKTEINYVVSFKKEDFQ